MKKWRNILSVFVLCIFAGTSLAQTGTPKGVLAVHKKRYINYPFGYRFKIPKGLIGTCSPPPMPQHGLTINLSGDEKRSRQIVFFAYYDVDDLGTLENVVKDKFEAFQKDRTLVRLTRQRVRFGRVPGMRLRFQYENDPIEQYYFFRAQKEVGVIYDVCLRTNQRHYERDRRVFWQVMATLQFRPLD